MYKNKEDILKNNGTVVFFNEKLTNFKQWEALFIIIMIVGTMGGFIFFNEFDLNRRFISAFGTGGTLMILTGMFSGLFRPWFNEGMR